MEEETNLTSSVSWLECSSVLDQQARFGHTGTYLARGPGNEPVMAIVGGSDGRGGFQKEMLLWSVQTGRFLPLDSSWELPNARDHHCAAGWDEAKLWVFGGRANGYLNDVWCLDFAGERADWKPVVLDAKSPVPDARFVPNLESHFFLCCLHLF